MLIFNTTLAAWFFLSKPLTTLWNIKILSRIDLPSMKADWFWLTRLPVTIFNWLAKILIMNLYKRLHKVMGRNSLHCVAASILGMREMNVEFISLSNFPLMKKCFTVAITSFLTICQAALKNERVNPSGLGALLAYKSSACLNLWHINFIAFYKVVIKSYFVIMKVLSSSMRKLNL